MPGNSCKVYTSVFFDDFAHLRREFEKGLTDYSEHYEIRYDLFKYKSIENLRLILTYLNSNNIDYIFTYRSANTEELMKIYSTAINFSPPIVDVDINSFKFKRDFFADTKLMVSFHGSNDDKISIKLAAMSPLEPDIYKIALLYTDNGKFLDDLDYLYHYRLENSIKLAFIPMGENNSFLRVISAHMVSDYAYGTYRDSTAPGQIETVEFNKLLSRFKGKYE
jgi:3-dehydroquinate dehydratase-1